jgi:lipopolysaccharide biosynthesis glycosyltransferase
MEVLVDQPTTKITQYAYVTLVMINPKYIIGAVTLAKSLKLSNTKNDIICMVTSDIYNSIEYRKILLNHFNYVIEVNYLSFNTNPFKTKKHQNMYKWIDKSYTKLTAMKLEQYEKVCLLDCDMVITNNIDHLFKLETPIGVFSNQYFDNIDPKHTNIDLQNFNCKKKIIINNLEKNHFYKNISIGKTGDYYQNIKPFKKISPDLIKKALYNNGFVVSGNIIIIKPSIAEFHEMKDIIYKLQPFGFNCSSGGDEQCISYYQSIIKSRSWTCLKQPYNVVPWKLKATLLKNQKPFIIHYNKIPKPWDINRNKWVDNEIWWNYFISIYEHKQICIDLKINFIDYKLDYCPYCYILNKQKNNHKLLECINLYI